MSTRQSPARRRRSLIAIALAAAGVLLLGVALWGVLGSGILGGGHEDAPRDLHGRAVALEPGTVPDATTLDRMHAREDTGDRFVVPSVGLDVPLGELTMVDSTITPPGFRSAYRVRNLGVAPADADSGTVFVALHSLRGGGEGPGNSLIDVEEQTAKVGEGDRIEVAGVDYEVTGTEFVKKDRLGASEDVWADEPGRLVVITCLQRPDHTPSVDNLVVTARLAER